MVSNMIGTLHTDTIANAVWWTNAEMVTFIDEAVKRLAKMFNVFVRRDTSISTVAAAATVTAPSRHLATLHVAYNDRPLRPATTHELSALDEFYDSRAAGPLGPSHWYADKIGITKIGLRPVPIEVKTIGLIHTEHPADASDGSTIDVPTVIADYLEWSILREAVAKESDAQSPEVAQHLDQVLRFTESIIGEYWGAAQ